MIVAKGVLKINISHPVYQPARMTRSGGEWQVVCNQKNQFLEFHKKNKILFFVLSIFLLISTTPIIAGGIGNGKDGSPSISGVVNAYTFLINDVKKCDYQLQVADANNFYADDLILIIQMQGAIIDGTNTSTYGTLLDDGDAGNYEFAKVKSVSGNIISLKYSLLRSYQVAGNVQIVRVPQ